MLSKIMENETVQAAFPLLGAAVGGMLVTAASERHEIPRARAALGVAAIGFLASTQLKGPLKGLLTGAAAGSICVAVMEKLYEERPRLLFGDKPVPQAVKPNPDGITRADLSAALSDFAEKTKAMFAEKEKEHLGTLTELKEHFDTVVKRMHGLEAQNQALVDRLRRADATIAQLRQELQRREQARNAAVASTAAAEIVPAADDTAPVGEENIADTDSAHTTAAAVEAPGGLIPEGVDPGQLEHAQKVFALLDERERAILSGFIANSSKSVVDEIQSRILAYQPEEVVTLLRESGLFASGVVA